MPERERRMLRMLVGSLVTGVAKKETSLLDGAILLWKHPQVLAELRDLLEVLAALIEHVALPLSTHTEVPLEVHARYTRLEILAAFDVGEGAKVAPWQTNVYWVPDARADLFAFTLDKTTGQFSPTTRYRVAVNNYLANGGDGFSVLTQGTNAVDAGLDIDALAGWLAKGQRVPAIGRVRNLTR